ncbi:HD-GYP domain-containing protein [Litchfieldia salsa]|uniref:HD-GYP domain, c-di-GMP phosphodiesterase class II (Or its inactivated variant) n=1 Tax=Litchfieldia salsa TaxID=930152 RepID=A0A1H0WDW9_9BACI|nr:HD-GYP domain-containing protein [Litchfieldia salsa]SDP88685.1 HD-GYP domain, c-di-GMP phosphodiesterase class II (or its inactivated variant) [Litchfieldia salsa]
MNNNFEISFELVGKKIGQDIYSDHGILLLKKGTTLTETHIVLLQNYKFGTLVEIEDKYPNDKLNAKMQKLYDQNLKEISTLFQNINLNNSPPIKELINAYQPLIEQATDHTDSIRYLHGIKDYDEYTYRHSINVGMISAVIGKLLGRSKKDIFLLGQMGLLHDIGKTMISPDIINKPGRLDANEWQEITRHTIYGYQILKEVEDLDIHIPAAALLHHERIDGSGYPNGVKEKDLPFLVQILSVADTYDAISTERVYQAKKPDFVGINILVEEAYNNKLNPAIVFPFVRYLMRQYIRKEVVLNTGDHGEIIFIHDDEPHQPLIITNEEYVDLRKNRKIRLSDVVRK